MKFEIEPLVRPRFDTDGQRRQKGQSKDLHGNKLTLAAAPRLVR